MCLQPLNLHSFEYSKYSAPAYYKEDGVDYVPMKGWKNALINLLNIAGTGPIFGPIQGILFGPIAFITIPIGNVIAGAMHDYFSGMLPDVRYDRQVHQQGHLSRLQRVCLSVAYVAAAVWYGKKRGAKLLAK